jgi:integrase
MNLLLRRAHRVAPPGRADRRPKNARRSRCIAALACASASSSARRSAASWPSETLLTGRDGGQLPPWALERAVRSARAKVDGLPDDFRYHDLRHYLASLLIASGADVKTVQARLRHASAKTTLDTYGHLWPDRDESTRAAIDSILAARAEQERNRADVR